MAGRRRGGGRPGGRGRRRGRTAGDGRTAGVEVAVDAAGGDRTYTYLVPDRLRDLEPGEAVLVEFGRRQALGIVLAEAAALPAVAAKPVVDGSAPTGRCCRR